MKTLLKDAEKLLEYVFDAMAEGVVLVDKDLCIQYMNTSSKVIFDGFVTQADYQGKYLYDVLNVRALGTANGPSPYLLDCLETGKPYTGLVREYPNGKAVSLNLVSVIENGETKGLLLTVEDITKIIEVEREADMAFSLTLPNGKTESKLKATVEYQDLYDPNTKRIKITGIINDGGYRHVVNSLKIFASLSHQGITKLIGIEKDALVRAIILHDLGKVQPMLNVGDVVDPKDVFEDGKLHAFRGAELAKHYYHESDEIVELIRYHHHREDELPESFPWHQLPMFRLFQLIDGTSAAVTRGGVEIGFQVSDSTVYLTERNQRPEYNGSWQYNLYTGERKRVEATS